MIATWMLYAVAVGGLITFAASAVDRVARSRGRPTRFIWLAAIAATVAWPLAHAIQQLVPRNADPTLMPFTITLQPVIAASVSSPDRAALLDRGLLALWILLSVLLVVRLARGVISLRRTQRGWSESDVDGMRVRLSDNVGPAVVGLRPMDVVLPKWILSLDPHLRAIVLRHEEEHRVARDPYLLCAAGVAVALMPWNPALWLQARRIRLAIEMDCDGRVLVAHPSPERYGMLMLTISQRRSVTPAMFAPMLSEPTTQLERRILAMRATRHRLARLTLYGGLTIAAAALFVACALESNGPTGPNPSPSRVPTRVESPYFDYQVEQEVAPKPGNMAPRYPDLLRKAEITGEVLAQFVVDTMGHAEMATFKVLKTDHDLFTATVRASLPNMQFYPARVGGRAVRQIVQMPFQFSLSKATKAPGPLPQRTPNERPATGANVVAGAGTTPRANSAYIEFQVTKRATPYADNGAPRYPDALRAANIEGNVLAQFIVDENGHAVMDSFKVLKSDHDLFTNAVRHALPTMRFHPAEANGRPVRALLQMPFTFSLTK